jgi:transcriptional regulator with XRE-family HTH domain
VRPRGGRSEREDDAGGVVDANAVVSYNIKAIRERRGMTQQAVADRLAQFSGHRLPQASISAMERSFEGKCHRRFDAHELYLLSVVFDVPIAYFFIPPPSTERVLADTGRPLWQLYLAFLGRLEQLEALDERLAEVDFAGQDDTEQMLGALFGVTDGARGWLEHYRSWRRDRLDRLGGEWGDGLAEALGVLSNFAREIRALRPQAFASRDVLDQPGRLILGKVGSSLVATEDRTSSSRWRQGARQGDRSAGWSPLRAAGTPTGAQKAARALADAGPKDGAENLKFFGAMAEQLLWPLLYTAAVAERSMVDVVRWVLSQDRPTDGMPGEVASLLDAELVSDDALRRSWAAAAMTGLAAIWDLDERTRGATYATAQTLVALWQGTTPTGVASRDALDQPVRAWTRPGSLSSERKDQ